MTVGVTRMALVENSNFFALPHLFGSKLIKIPLKREGQPQCRRGLVNSLGHRERHFLGSRLHPCYMTVHQTINGENMHTETAKHINSYNSCQLFNSLLQIVLYFCLYCFLPMLIIKIKKYTAVVS